MRITPVTTSTNVINYYGKQSEKKQNESEKSQVLTAKTKKAISECKYIVLGLVILYFGVKHTFKLNRLRKAAKEAEEKLLKKLNEETGEKVKKDIPKVINAESLRLKTQEMLEPLKIN